MTQLTYECACLVKQFGGERAGSHACAIGFHDAIHIANLVGAHAETCAGTRTDGVRRCDEGITAEVYVEHGALRTFAEHAFATAQEVVDFVFRVDYGELTQVVDTL